MRAERKLLHGRLWKHWAAAWHRLSKEKYMKGSTVIFRNSLGFKSDIPFWRMLCKNRFNHHIISECLKKIKHNRSQDKKLLKIRKHRDYWKGYIGAEHPGRSRSSCPTLGRSSKRCCSVGFCTGLCHLQAAAAAHMEELTCFMLLPTFFLPNSSRDWGFQER